ncbi:hypothetical protein [Geomicrobium sp. JCM 19038]|uniref:hypothetical protein n=1 Tax=Geomicrobium sp. JCM 19038 TaxID=1460635 RepID=UPI00045F3D8C|nr:hypothetical protein [Geomicrobium sp. JCM 19038]GAK07345.1 hypothetical protein JCM19038_1078 [Geomicrobium sp. JCM 19038]
MGKSRHHWNGCSCREDRNSDDRNRENRNHRCGNDDNVFESGYQKPAAPWYPKERESRPDCGRKPEKEKSRSRLRGTIYISCDR